MDFLKTVDTWFLIIAVVLLAAFFVWAVQYILNGLKDSIKILGTDFKESVTKMERFITDLYEHKSGHETRIAVLESVVGVTPPSPLRQGPGRRSTDSQQEIS